MYRNLLTVVLILLHAASSKSQISPDALTAELPFAVPGHEQRLAAAIRAQLTALSPKTDNLGNVIVTLGGGSPQRVIAVALDEPGYVVSGITPDGYLRVQRLPQAAVTPVFDVLNFAQPVWVFGRDGKRFNGVFAGLSVHLQPGRVAGPKMNHPDELFVDIGAKNAAEVRAAGIDVLDAVLPQRNLTKLGADQIAGPSAGDRAVLLAVLNLLHGVQASDVRGTLTIAFLAQHWTGGRGMNRLLTELHPDEMIFVGHVTPRAEKDEKEKTGIAAVKPGTGVVIGSPSSGEERNSGFSDELSAIAKARDIPVTMVAANMPRILTYVPAAAYPKRSLVLGIPSLWPETPAETISDRDVRMLSRLLREYSNTSEPPAANRKPSEVGTSSGTIESLVTAYGASGHEAMVREKVKELLPEWARKQAKTDEAGNLILDLSAETGVGKSQRLAFVAHLDELGYDVKGIEPDGRIALEVLGGGYTQYFLGHAALVHTSDGRALGAVMELPAGWDKPGFQWPQDLRTMDDPVHAYVGTTSREETQKLGIKPGDWVTIQKAYRPLLGSRANARSFDDRVGCAALVAAVKSLGPTPLGRDVTFVWSTKEEVGLNGAAAAAALFAADKKIPDIVFAIDTFVSDDSPLESRRFGNAELGKGFVVRAVDNSNIVPVDLVDKVVKLARANSIPVQYGVTGGGNDGSVFTRYGSVDVALGWPLRYSHSPAEVIDTGDLHALGRIIAVLAKSW